MHERSQSSAPVKIVSLSTVYPHPAAPAFGIFVRRRLEELARLPGVEVKVVSPRPLVRYAMLGLSAAPAVPPPPGRNAASIEVLRPRWLYPPVVGGINGLLLFLCALPTFRTLRRRFPFDLIDAHFCHPEGVAAGLLAAIFQVPFTITFRGVETDHGRYFWRRTWMQWTAKRAARIFTVSPHLGKFAVSLGADPSRVRLVPNGVDSTVFHPLDRTSMRRKHQIPDGVRLVLSVGGLVERKGHHRVIRALAPLIAEGLNAHVWIVGGDAPEPRVANLRELPAELGIADRVRFFGVAGGPTLAELYSAADLFCLASNREGWPNVVHEAQACGAPVVATDVGAIPTMIHSSNLGTVVPSQDELALTAALRDALTREWDRDAIAAAGQARNWERVAEEVANEFRAVVAASAQPS